MVDMSQQTIFLKMKFFVSKFMRCGCRENCQISNIPLGLGLGLGLRLGLRLGLGLGLGFPKNNIWRHLLNLLNNMQETKKYY